MSERFEDRLRRALADWRVSPKRGCELVAPLDHATDHTVGDPGAPLAVVEYSLYGWPVAARHERMLRAALRGLLLSGRIRFALRHFSAVDASPHALLAARAVEAADRQGRFWDLHEAISAWIADDGLVVDVDKITRLAQDRGIDIDRLLADMDRPEVDQRILRDFTTGIASGVNGTPTLFIAGIRQIVDTPEDLLRRLDRALEGDFAALWPPVNRSDQPMPAAHVAPGGSMR